MRQATLTRFETGDEGTFGKFSTAAFECWMIELPWRHNAKEKSCIPAGVYIFKRVNSPKHGECYEAEHVAGDRTHVQIHRANWAGDKDKGKKCELEGCFAPGRAIGELGGQKAVISSKDAVAGLEAALENDTFELTIKWADGVSPEGAA